MFNAPVLPSLLRRNKRVAYATPALVSACERKLDEKHGPVAERRRGLL